MRTSGLKALMVAQVFRSIAFGMVSMFGVVFIYSLGDSLMQGLTFMLYFFVFQRMVTIFTLPLSGYLTSRWGYRWTMLGGLLAVVGKLGVLTQVEVFNVGQLFWAALFGGIGMSSYWLGYHGVMLDDNEDSRVGEQEGQLQALKRGSIIVGPILAGFLVEWFGFSIMFIVAMGMFMLAAIPLFLMPRHKLHKDGFSVRKMIRLMKSEKRVWWSVWGRFFQESVQDIFWPVYLFLVIKSFSTFGLVNGGVLILYVVAVIVAGKMYDKRPLRRGFPLAGFLLLRFRA